MTYKAEDVWNARISKKNTEASYQEGYIASMYAYDYTKLNPRNPASAYAKGIAAGIKQRKRKKMERLLTKTPPNNRTIFSTPSMSIGIDENLYKHLIDLLAE